MWALFEAGDLTPQSELTGEFTDDNVSADIDSVMLAIKDAFDEEQARQERMREAADE